jgi:hypothetical protein
MYYWLLIVLSLFLFEIPFGIFNDKSSYDKSILDFSELPALEEGDIVFRRGVSVESYAVMVASRNSRYSHVGLIHYDDNGNMGVAHIEPGDSEETNTIRFEPLSVFWATERASKGGIYRSKMNTTQRLTLKKYIDNVYANHVEFDDGYDLFDASKIYCTELLFHAFHAAELELTNGKLDTILFPKRKPIIFPGTILKSRELQTIFLFNQN